MFVYTTDMYVHVTAWVSYNTYNNYWIISLSYNYVNIPNVSSLGGLHLLSWTVLFKIKINDINGGRQLDSGDVELILSVRYLSGLVL